MYLGEKQLEDLAEVNELEEHIRRSIRKAYHNNCRVTTKTKFKVERWIQEIESRKREAPRLKKEYIRILE